MPCAAQISSQYIIPVVERVDGARHEIDRDLIEQIESVVDTALVDRHASGADTPDHHGRGNVETSSEIDGGRGMPTRSLHVAAHETFVPQHDCDDGVRLLLVVSVQQPFGSADPTANSRHEPGVHHQEHGDGRRGHRRAGQIVLGDIQRVQVFPGADGSFEVAEPVEGTRSEFESCRSGRLRSACVEQIDRNLPLPTAHRACHRPEPVHVAL